jgi:hypothetical protein
MGKLNGEGGYKFTLTVIDGQLSGGGGTDKVRLKLFNKSGTVVYDTQYGASDAANPTLAVGSGSNILIKTTGVSAGPAVAGGAIADGESQPIEASRPAAFALSPGRPNPFTTATELHYALPEQAHVELSLYNALGERVEVLANGIQEPGYKSIELDGRRLTPGMYFLRFRATVGGAQPFVQTRKLLVIR